jgi:glycogen operon protein
MLLDEVPDSAGTAKQTKGARVDGERQLVRFAVFSRNASAVQAWVYASPKGADEILRVPLTRGPGDIWSGSVALADLPGDVAGVLYYGLRAWGPNWPFDRGWTPGTANGFICDVDESGNRFNPNKLLLDPYARDISHDPAPRLSPIDPNEVVADYYSGPEHRLIDTGPIAPKGVVVLAPTAAPSVSGPGAAAPASDRPTRPLKDDIIYELHVRGFTKLDPSLPPGLRGTFKGAGLKAGYLRDLGVTAVELLPVFQFANEQNDDGDPRGDNCWGYMTLGFFAANRRFAADPSPGAPAREFREMVQAFHREGIKVFLDVVFNHTGEGLLSRTTEDGDSRCDDHKQLPDCAAILSFRGLDNAAYYTLRSCLELDGGRTNQRYVDNSACGASLNVAEPIVSEFIIDSLHYWADEMGVDGFRFDLGPVLGNCLARDRFVFDWSAPDSLLTSMDGALPLRSDTTPEGVDLVAEPWDAVTGSYLGRFPDGWAEWNDIFRTALRRAENKLGVETVRPWELANAVSGSAQQFQPRGAGARPWNSINYIASHDGLTMRDLFAFNRDDAWDHGGDAASQRKAVRNVFALLATSAGVPMFMAGDELMRTQAGISNAAAIDDRRVYVNWDHMGAYQQAGAQSDAAALAQLRQYDDIRTFEFAREMLSLRHGYRALRPEQYFTGTGGAGLKDVAWYAPDGSEMSGGGWSDPGRHFIGYRIDTRADRPSTGGISLYIAYSWHDDFLEIALPPNLPGAQWRRLADTAGWMEPTGNIDRSRTVIAGRYGVHERSVVIFVEG